MRAVRIVGSKDTMTQLELDDGNISPRRMLAGWLEEDEQLNARRVAEWLTRNPLLPESVEGTLQAQYKLEDINNAPITVDVNDRNKYVIARVSNLRMTIMHCYRPDADQNLWVETQVISLPALLAMDVAIAILKKGR